MKSNIGHLEGASGIAAIIKSVLVLEKGIIAPNANFEKLNPQIDGDSMNLRVSPDCVRAFFLSLSKPLALGGPWSILVDEPEGCCIEDGG